LKLSLAFSLTLISKLAFGVRFGTGTGAKHFIINYK